MTDSRLQQLKRAWEASGSVADEAAYLCERVRVGELAQERLELAAWFGDHAAQSAINIAVPAVGKRDWCEALMSSGSATTVALAQVIAEICLAVWKAEHPSWREELATSLETPAELLDASDAEVEEMVELLREWRKTNKDTLLTQLQWRTTNFAAASFAAGSAVLGAVILAIHVDERSSFQLAVTIADAALSLESEHALPTMHGLNVRAQLEVEREWRVSPSAVGIQRLSELGAKRLIWDSA